MAQRCDNMVSFYRKSIDFESTVTLLVLSKEDWSKHTNFPVYGMPHYTDSHTLTETRFSYSGRFSHATQMDGRIIFQYFAAYLHCGAGTGPITGIDPLSLDGGIFNGQKRTTLYHPE